VNQLPQPDHVIDRLPPVFRIQSIERLPFDARNLLNVAVVFHERAVLRVEWLCRHPDSRLTVGSLVSIRWLGRPTSTLGAIRIARLVKLERPEASLNPFDTVPHAWVRDRELVARAGRFWEGLGRCSISSTRCSGIRGASSVISRGRVRCRGITTAATATSAMRWKSPSGPGPSAITRRCICRC
jgi:hypothetical protein